MVYYYYYAERTVNRALASSGADCVFGLARPDRAFVGQTDVIITERLLPEVRGRCTALPPRNTTALDGVTHRSRAYERVSEAREMRRARTLVL